MRDNNQQDLRERLEEIRKEYGTTFSFMAQAIKVHRATISLFVAGKRGMSLDNEIKLRKYLNETFPKKEG